MPNDNSSNNNGTNSSFGFKNPPPALDPYVVKDPEALVRNIAKMLEELGKAAAAWNAPRESGKKKDDLNEPLIDAVETLSKVCEYWLSEPQRTIEAQTLLLTSYMGIWTRSLQNYNNKSGQQEEKLYPADKRFSNSEWEDNTFFKFMRDAYWVTSDWADRMVNDAQGLDNHTKHKANFYVRQIVNALSPSNFILTNPELYKKSVEENGANLARGMKMFAEDIASGKGDLKLRQTDENKFSIGENIAVTPGKVVAQNEICQVIQYECQTEDVIKTPLVICPPWINKYYILDLNPQKSFIRWAVSQGHSVFVISWVNPDERHRDKGWEDYISDGLEFAVDTAIKGTNAKSVNTIGYCVGGTLLSAALALHGKRNDKRISSATFFASQVDFENAGDLQVFVDEKQLKMVNDTMAATGGYLDGSKMVNAFNMLRSADLIWPYVVSNYLMGKEPMPFDLLYWNSDSTRMAEANHSYYLRNCYLENNLSNGRMVLDGEVLSLKNITIPIYNLAAKEDHIAPAASVFAGSQFFKSDVTYVMSGSGHIAGVVNPPEKQKYQYWTGAKPEGSFDEWVVNATEHKGSWWPHWHQWIENLCLERVKARKITLPALEDAPGSYVKSCN